MCVHPYRMIAFIVRGGPKTGLCALYDFRLGNSPSHHSVALLLLLLRFTPASKCNDAVCLLTPAPPLRYTLLLTSAGAGDGNPSYPVYVHIYIVLFF